MSGSGTLLACSIRIGISDGRVHFVHRGTRDRNQGRKVSAGWHRINSGQETRWHVAAALLSQLSRLSGTTRRQLHACILCTNQVPTYPGEATTAQWNLLQPQLHPQFES